MKIAVVIPCYRVKDQLCNVINSLPNFITNVYVVDDCCPENSTDTITELITNIRIKIIKNSINLGVGGAVKVGFKEALKDGNKIIIKMDGDGQMRGEDISRLIKPLIDQKADYTKGNRFIKYENIKMMPIMRLIGNSILSFMSKFSTGYWQMSDPTNGFIAITDAALLQLPLEKISNRYFFESDMLFRLGMISAVVIDIPIKSLYGDEKSNLSICKVSFEFLYKNIKNFFKRIFYFYFIREANIASFQLLIGTFLTIFGITYGIIKWDHFHSIGLQTPNGIIMICMTTLLVGIQMLLSFINYDVTNFPKRVITSNYEKNSSD